MGEIKKPRFLGGTDGASSAHEDRKVISRKVESGGKEARAAADSPDNLKDIARLGRDPNHPDHFKKP